MRIGFRGVAKIYALVDTDNVPFYVGRTIGELSVRLYAHIKEAAKNEPWSNAIKNHKIRSLDYKVNIRQLDLIKIKGETKHAAMRSASRVEVRWIKRFLDAGYELCNRTHADSDFTHGSKERINRMLANKKAA